MHNNQFYHHNSVTTKFEKIASYLKLEQTKDALAQLLVVAILVSRKKRGDVLL